jgi:hypothetical protein
MTILSAAALYFMIVFAAGFLLGSIRVLWVEPKLGQAPAVLCESPLLLAVMVLAARWVPSLVGIEKSGTGLVLMGAIALALQQAADFLVGTRLRGITVAQQLAYFATKAGLIYAFLLIAFAIMPLLLNQTAWHG